MAFLQEQAAGEMFPIHELFTKVAQEKPDAIAVVCVRGHLSYGELERKAESLAIRLTQRHIDLEARVALCLGRVADMVVAMLATLKVGAAYVPLDPAYPRERLNFMLKDSGAQVVVTEREMQTLFDGQTPMLFLEEPEAIAQAPAAVHAGRGAVSVNARNLAWIIYTSGSTGQPKGVGIEHRAAVALVKWSEEVFTAEEMSGVLAATSWCFDLSAFEIWAPLLRGGTAIIADNALELANLLGRDQVRLINSVPVAVNELVSLGNIPDSVETVCLAGEPLTRDLVDKLYALPSIKRVLNLYGPTEDTTYSTWAEMRQADRGTPPIGVAITGSSTYVLDDSSHPVSPGEIGELYLGGIGLARGYIGHPAMTAGKFVPNPFDQRRGERLYRTGDLVRVLAEGNLEFAGRVDHQVKIRGLRIELGEIEAALEKHERVQEALVTAQEKDGEKGLVGYVIASSDGAERSGIGAPDKLGADLQDFLRSLLPQFMVPSAVLVLPRWPLTLNGKIDRKRLPQPQFSSLGSAYVAPRTPVEQSVAEIWQDILKIEKISVTASFFHLGGHSLAATRIITRVREVFGVHFPLQKVLEAVSIEQLSSLIEAAQRDGAGKTAADRSGQDLPLSPVGRSGLLPLSYFQQRMWLSEQLNPASGALNVFVPLSWGGKLSFPAASQAFSEIVCRHAILRSRFETSAERPVQRMVSFSPLAIPVVDLTGLTKDQRKAEVLRLAPLEGRRPFSLETESPIRICYLRLQSDEHILMITTHHIATDGASIAILGDEFSWLYQAMSDGRPSPLPELIIQYSDFASWQREWIAGNALDDQRVYWKRQLEWAPRHPGLETDHPRRSTMSLRGTYQAFVVPAELVQSFLKLGASESATAFMSILAAFEALLYRISGEVDWVIGTDIANRTQPHTESSIGLFVNVLALHTRISPGITFRQLLQKVRVTALEAYAHQDLPFDEVMKLTGRDHTTSPLFQVFFVLQHEAGSFMNVPDVVVSKLMFENMTALRELSLYGWLVGSDLNLVWNYRTDLFEPSTIERWTRNLLALMESVVRRPDAFLEDLSLAQRGTELHRDRPDRQIAQKRFKATQPKAIPLAPRT